MGLHPHLDAILQTLESYQFNLSELLLSLLQSPLHSDHPAHQHLSQDISKILSSLFLHPRYHEQTRLWVCKTSAELYAKRIGELSAKGNGWHFSAIHASPAQIQEFHIHDLAKDIHAQAPEIWDLLGAMLTTNATQHSDLKCSPVGGDIPHNNAEDDDDMIYWNELADTNEDEATEMESDPDETTTKKALLRETLLVLVNRCLF